MKKNYLWTMAALFVSGLVLTSCEMQDNPNPKPGGMQVKEVLNLDFEAGEVADYFALGKAEAALVTPEANLSTGRAAAIVSGSDRGDYVKAEPDLTDAVFYTVEMDVLPAKSPKTTQFAVVTKSAWEGWDTWLSNWGIFWKNNSTQEHTGLLFSLEFTNSNTASLLVDINAEGQGVNSGAEWTFEDNVWYHLTLTVKPEERTSEYTIVSKEDPNTVIATGVYAVPAGDSMYIKGIYWRNGRLNSGTGAIGIDNVQVLGVF